MDQTTLEHLVDSLLQGQISREDFTASMKAMPYLDLGDVKLDTHRALRRGFAEIVYSPSKSYAQLLKIAAALKEETSPCLFSRISSDQVELIRPLLPTLVYHEEARLAGLNSPSELTLEGLTVIAAGSSDTPVAEEAAITAEYMGCQVQRIYDVGVAGIHRLLAFREQIASSRAVVVVAGMEGALPSVVTGLTSCPVFAVPTSVGYGVNFRGLSALLTMINSCATGLSVVNIDNGLGAGVSAALVLKQCR